ncbi:hypothetical protein IMG5_161310, partial [Ichthyophthirius multifiliis]
SARSGFTREAFKMIYNIQYYILIRLTNRSFSCHKLQSIFEFISLMKNQMQNSSLGCSSNSRSAVNIKYMIVFIQLKNLIKNIRSLLDIRDLVIISNRQIEMNYIFFFTKFLYQININKVSLLIIFCLKIYYN